MTTATKSLTPCDWQDKRFGSQKAFLEHWDRLGETEEGEIEQLRLNLECMQAICEDAGIPYHGWLSNSLDCSRKRLLDSESERETVHILNKNLGATAYDHWVTRHWGFSSNPYCANH